jgi:hypothetical protein
MSVELAFCKFKSEENVVEAVNLLLPVKVLLSIRSVEEAVESVAESVVPSHVRLLPIFTLPTGPSPLPFKIPVRVVEPVPPPLGNNVVTPSKGSAFLNETTKTEPRNISPETASITANDLVLILCPRIIGR